jgi:hypothetical protein
MVPGDLSPLTILLGNGAAFLKAGSGLVDHEMVARVRFEMTTFGL